MKKIDPLYIILLSVVLLIVSIFAFNNSKQELKKSQTQLIETSNIAVKFSSIKSGWGNRENSITSVEKIVKALRLKSVDKKITKRKIKIKINKISLRQIDKFVNKILNEKLNILKLNISKDSVLLEVGL